MTKIALIGSAPSSVRLAPYDDPSWQIWSCSPGAYPHVRRCDAHFEIHRWEPPGGVTGDKPWFTPDYINWMARVKGPIYMIEAVPQLPNSVAYPKDEILERFGPYFQTNSVSWMVCLAVASGAKEVGLWGVDMAAKTEWTFQRTGLQTLLWYVWKHYGVKITLPPESDLWVPPVQYGFCEADPHHVKLQARRAEIAGQIVQAQNNLHVAQQTLTFMQGAEDDNEYHISTWCLDRKARQMAFTNGDQAPVAVPGIVPAPKPEVTEIPSGYENGRWPNGAAAAE